MGGSMWVLVAEWAERHLVQRELDARKVGLFDFADRMRDAADYLRKVYDNGFSEAAIRLRAFPNGRAV